jgi:hypothetical protein
MLRRLLPFALLLFTSPAATAQTEGSESASLEGWTEIGLVVEPIGSDAVALGLSRQQIRSQTERRLRKAGLTIAETALGRVYVHIGLVAGKLGYSGAVQVGFVQRVTLGNGRRSWGTTWERGRVLGGPHDSLAGHFGELLDDLLDSFIEDWLAANPPQ